MKLTQKTLGTLIGICLLTLVAGTLTWDVLERVAALLGWSVSLSVGPIGFDLGVVAFFIRVNPGSLLGVVPGVMLFKGL